MVGQQPLSLRSFLCSVTALFITAQLSFFFIHEHISSIFDIVTRSSLFAGHFHYTVWITIVTFIFLQLLAYLLLITFICFVAENLSQFFNPTSSNALTYKIGIMMWVLSMLFILLSNSKLYPYSFFAPWFSPYLGWQIPITIILLIYTLCAYVNCFTKPYKRKTGAFFLFLATVALLDFDELPLQPSLSKATVQQKLPTLIFIGFDSLRPDFINDENTPAIKQFLTQSVNFQSAYTPLARTFPSWVSILTAQYPKHHDMRMNLVASDALNNIDNLAKHLQRLGYQTIYATDEKRFSNITEKFGFDRVVGPKMGVNDFILGSLTDFPLTNLLIQLPISRYLFPYNYANRAAAITYDPAHFNNLLHATLRHDRHSSVPLFLAIHLCLSHWPYFKAGDENAAAKSTAANYERAIHHVDQQFQSLLSILQKENLLNNAYVVLLSDHGTTFGLLHDRLLSKDKYRGDKSALRLLPLYTLNQSDVYSLATSYGQGTDVLSLKQNHVLLALRGYGLSNPAIQSTALAPKNISHNVSLLDIAPTILDLAKLPPLRNTDGLSLLPLLQHNNGQAAQSAYNKLTHRRTFFFETADSFAEIETDQIAIEKVLQQRLRAYQVDPKTTYLTMNPGFIPKVLRLKQRAILFQDWLLAYYPASIGSTLNNKKNRLQLKTISLPAFTVLVNIKSGEWTINPERMYWSKHAPLAQLKQQIKAFYGDEVVKT